MKKRLEIFPFYFCLFFTLKNKQAGKNSHLQIRPHAELAVVPHAVVAEHGQRRQLAGEALLVVHRFVLAHLEQDGGGVRGDALVGRVEQLGERCGGALGLDHLRHLLVDGQLAQDAGGHALEEEKEG